MTYEFTIAPADFDLSLIPAEARTVGSPEFGQAVHRFLTNEFKDFGGTARIVVGKDTIQVTWNPESSKAEPLQSVVEKLKQGQYPQAIQLLELLLSRNPDDPEVLYNLGMALSDTGQIDRAIRHLSRLARLCPREANVRVALGVALVRGDRLPEAIRELRAGLEIEPQNPFALRNLGACLLKTDRAEEGAEVLQRAADASPGDQQAAFGVAEAAFVLGRLEEADEAYRRAIDLDPSSPIAEMARDRLGEIAQKAFRGKTPGVERMDAVMYLLGAIEKFEGLPRSEIQKIGFEVATLGMKGFDVNDPSQQYRLRSLPGEHSGLHMVCLMYAAFQILDPSADIGFDLRREYALAQDLRRKRSAGGE